ncbi:hypothetical protein M8J77_019748 [Diaphorina citri]|nr:hypothetical protein M8J77_019748 [Diaphorina citri]
MDAEDLMSPLFHMPPSTSCFYRVSSSLTTSPSVYDKIKSFLDRKENSVDDKITKPDKEKNPIFKSVENVRMLNRADLRKPFVGTLHLTTTALIFQDTDCKKETWILLMHIASIERGPLSTLGSPLIIRCKTFLSVTFVIPRERECYDIYVTLQKLSRPVHIEELYCFTYTSTTESPKSYGWDFFSLEQEFKRMQVPNDEWCLTNLNKNYELCDTYPRFIYVPTSATTSILLGSSKFRSKGRLPVLTYLHRSNQAVICRCSQPLSGFSARCLEDEQLLNCILRTNPGSNFMYVVDTRPRINAMANRAAGKGYENENFYENIKFHFFGIENIHVMRSSLAKLIETCEANSPSVNSFLSGLDSSGWLRHIKVTLDTAWFIAQAIVEGVSVVVHCSDGWDRTVQVCSLASLMLDPYYRTIKGFQALIEKDWLSFGYKFTDRCGVRSLSRGPKGSKPGICAVLRALIEKDWLSFGHKFTDRCGHLAGDPREVSPVFVQFLECSWQLSVQFPQAFEFNEIFLLTLQDHVTSCQFGTFVGNCEKDRLDLRLSENTYSLWGYMANRMEDYINPLYSPDAHPDFIRPDLSPQNIRFWRGMFCRFENGVHPRENLADVLLATRDHSSSLDDHVKFLQKRIFSFKQSLSKKCELVKNGVRELKNNRIEEALPTPSLPPVENKPDNNSVSREESDLSVPPVEKKPSDKINESLLSTRLSLSSLSEETEGRRKVENGQHPLNPNSDVTCDYECNGIEALLDEEINSIAIDWKPVVNINQCQCSTPFDHFTRKYHCFKCGDVLCLNCIGDRSQLPGHLTRTDSIVCKSCLETSSPSNKTSESTKWFV